jgi:hypothetical protein
MVLHFALVVSEEGETRREFEVIKIFDTYEDAVRAAYERMKIDFSTDEKFLEEPSYEHLLQVLKDQHTVSYDYKDYSVQPAKYYNVEVDITIEDEDEEGGYWDTFKQNYQNKKEQRAAAKAAGGANTEAGKRAAQAKKWEQRDIKVAGQKAAYEAQDKTKAKYATGGHVPATHAAASTSTKATTSHH